MRNRIFLSLVFLLALIAGPALAFDMPDWPDWQSDLNRDHPLVGQVIGKNGETVPPATVIDAASRADFVILGEVHDNPDHHLLQAAIIRALAERGRRLALVFEMIPRTMQTEIDDFLSTETPMAAGFGAAVGWEARGWPDWSIYQPILEAGLAHGIPVHAGNLETSEVRRIASEGLGALEEDRAEKFLLNRELPEAQTRSLQQSLKDGHCGLLPDAAIGPMILAQRARDGSMADAMLAARTPKIETVVLIAGSGHARGDYGVPAVLAALDTDAATRSISMAEAAAGADRPDDYMSGGAGHDFVIVTPRMSRPDPCEELRRRMNAGD